MPAKKKKRKARAQLTAHLSDLREHEEWDHDRFPVVAILCSDVHLSHKPPALRSVEDDWYAAMDRTLEQVRWLAAFFHVPVVIAGDLFHHWNSPAELINFAMKSLPSVVYAIPGQHDMPNHSEVQMDKSAYETLVRAGRIIDLTPGTSYIHDDNLTLYGFRWKADITEPHARSKDGVNLAVVHRFLWKKGYSYPGAPESGYVGHALNDLKGYNAAVFGDNHQSFVTRNPSCEILNAGTLMRRSAAELNYSPHVGLLTKDALITHVELDTREDKYLNVQQAVEMVERAVDMTDFIASLSDLFAGACDFGQSVKRFLDDNGISDSVRARVMEALDERDGSTRL